MTVEEMRAELEKYCDSRHLCIPNSEGDKCPLHFGDCTWECDDDESTVNAYYKIFGYPPTDDLGDTPPIEVEEDIIKHPNHYCRDGAMECIDEMVMVFGKEVVKHFCLCNIWKYRYRSAAKNGEEDINKSDQYIRIYKELCSNE